MTRENKSCVKICNSLIVYVGVKIKKILHNKKSSNNCIKNYLLCMYLKYIFKNSILLNIFIKFLNKISSEFKMCPCVICEQAL